MMKRFTRLLAVLLALTMLLSCAAFAETTQATAQPAENAGNYSQSDKDSLAALSAAGSGDTAAAKPAADAEAPALPADGTYVPGELLVKVRRSASLQSAESMFGQFAESTENLMSVPERADGAALASGETAMDDWYTLALKQGTDMLTAWNGILGMTGVLYVQPNYIYHTESSTADVTENDPYMHSQTWLDQIEAPDAWGEVGSQLPGQNSNGTSIVVAVVDTGVDLDHPDLQDNLLTGYDFVNSDSIPDDDAGHGTHVAGIIAAEKNTIGVRGVAYGAKIMPVKVLGSDGHGSTAEIIKGIQYAAGAAVTVGNATVTAAKRADIINMSIGGYGFDESEHEAIQEARKAGCLVVVAAGNEGMPTSYVGDDYYGGYCNPANDEGVLTVMAMNKDCTGLANYSNYDSDPGSGSEYEIMAPGTNIMSTYMGGGYGLMTGTSMATPVTAGAAAVLMGMGCDADRAWEILVGTGTEKTGKTITVDGTFTELKYPALNLKAAVKAAKTGTYSAAPVIANASASASLASQTITSGDSRSITMDLSNTNISSRVYFYKNELLSTINVSFDNFGGPGTVTASGTVGGAKATGTSASVGLDDSGTIALSINGTPAAKDGELPIELTLKPSVGTAVTLSYSLSAYEVVLPSDITGISYVSENSRYELSSDSVTVTPGDTMGKLLYLDANLFVASGKSLHVNGSYNNYGMVVYNSSAVSINTEYTNNQNYGKTIISSASLVGKSTSNMQGNGYAVLVGCMVYDPHISIAYLNNCVVEGNGYKDSKYVYCSRVYCSGIYDCDKINVQCYDFEHNLVTGCTNATLTVNHLAQANTFVENFNKNDSSAASSVMTVYAPYYSGTEDQTYLAETATYEGFCFNNVVGPMNVYSPNTTDPTRVFGVYYQTVNNTGTDNGKTITPDGIVDTLNCIKATPTDISTDTQTSTTQGFADDSPAFITGVELQDYNYRQPGIIDYSLKFTFSTAVRDDCSPSCRSYYDPCAYGSSVSMSDDRTSCAVAGSTPVLGMDMVKYYFMTDFWTANKSTTDSDGTAITHYFGYTGAIQQTTYRFPIAYPLVSNYLDVTSEFTGTGTAADPTHAKLTWTYDGQPVDASAYPDSTAKIYLSVNDGDFTLLTENAAVAGLYTDTATTFEVGKYTYRVDLCDKAGKVVISGYTDLVCSPADEDMGIDFTAEKFVSADKASFDAALDGIYQTDGCLQFTIKPQGSGVTAGSIDFADQVKNCGLPYGAVKNNDGSITVYIGEQVSGGSAVLLAGENLFTVNASASDAADCTFSIDGSKIYNGDITQTASKCDWGKLDTCTYRYSPSFGGAAFDGNGGYLNVFMPSGGTGLGFCSTYSANGRMTGTTQVAVGSQQELIGLTGSNAALKLFCLDSNKVPVWKEITITSNG